jgi:uncharacterized SAM-binding protein YcdF (DUF218 family)
MLYCFSLFYAASKILLFFLSPLVWAFLLLFLGIFFPGIRWFKKFVLTGLIILYIFSNSLLLHFVVSAWEKPLQRFDSVTPGSEAIVVLGGMAALEKGSQRVVFSSSGDRLIQALELFSEGKAKRIVISGGAGNLLGEQKPESELVKEYLKRIGYADSLLFAETQSKNTAQNAEYTAILFSRNNWPKNIVLVTSAFHLYRATLCFEKQGFQVTGYGTDPLMPTERISVADALLPNADALSRWNLLIKEWVGILTYQLMGYI